MFRHAVGLRHLSAIFFLLNHDVSWCIHACSRLLSGGTYWRDFVDVNPPLSLYLYAPSVLLTRYLSLHIVYALESYIFLLASLSLLICAGLINKLFSRRFGLVIFAVLAFLFFIFPLFNFGQREHLLVLLIMPYIFATACLLENKTVAWPHRLLFSLLAGVGFALKPYFLPTLVLIESYVFWRIRARYFKERVESYIVLIFLSSYLIYLIFFQSNYLHFIVPQAYHYYYLGYHDPWRALWLSRITLFCVFLTGFFYIAKNNRAINTLWWLSMLGLLLAAFWQRTLWDYHFLPALCFSILLSFGLIHEFFISRTLHKNYLVMSLFSFIVFCVPALCFIGFFKDGVAYKKQHLPLIAFMQHNIQNHSLDVFSFRIHHVFSAIDYAQVNFVSRFPHFSLLPGMLNKEERQLTSAERAQVKRDEDQLIAMATDDLETKKPEIVLVDMQPYNSYLPSIHFDFIQFFSRSPRFRAAWQSYYYVTSMWTPAGYGMPIAAIQLYAVPSLAALQLAQAPETAVVLIGQGTKRRVYFLEQHAFLKWKNERVYADIVLTASEARALNHQLGVVAKEACPVANAVIARGLAAAVPREFSFQVYRRRPANTVG